MKFQLQLANETSESVYIDNDTNNKFNFFLHTFLNTFEASFPVKYKSIHRNKNGWITQAVIKSSYIRYCKILNKLIQEAKNSII
jgi:hypothetical protein